MTSDTARSAIIEMKDFAKSNGIKTAMTFSDPSMLEYFKDNVNEVLGDGVDLLFCNLQEAQLWSGEADLDKAVEALKTIAKQFAVTTGADGSLLWDGEQLLLSRPSGSRGRYQRRWRYVFRRFPLRDYQRHGL